MDSTERILGACGTPQISVRPCLTVRGRGGATRGTVGLRWSISAGRKGVGAPYPPPFAGFGAGEVSIVKSTLCGCRGWTSREIGVTGSLTPNSGVRQVANSFRVDVISEVGAVCGSAARTDLCGGRSAMAVPTATRIPVRRIFLTINLDSPTIYLPKTERWAYTPRQRRSQQ